MSSSLEAAYATLKQGSLWSGTGKCKGYAVANPGEAKLIDQYVADVAAGRNPAPPVLATKTGQGIVGIIAAGVPAPPPRKTYDIRALYDIEHGSYPGVFHDMHLSCIQTYQRPDGPDYQLVRDLDRLSEPDTGWNWLGGFAPSVTGGAMRTTPLKLALVMKAVGSSGHTVATHPRNSHIYVVIDDDQSKLMDGYSPAQIMDNLETIADYYDLLHTHDPLARVGVVEWKQTRMPWWADDYIGRRKCDFVLLDGYPNNDLAHGGYNLNRIPDQAWWAELAGKPYAFCLSVHDNNGQPALPDPDTYNRMVDQVEQTAAFGVWHFAWKYGTQKTVATDPDLQAAVGARMARLTP